MSELTASLFSFFSWITNPTRFTLFGVVLLVVFSVWELWDYIQVPRRLGSIRKFIAALEAAQRQLPASDDRSDFLLEETGGDIRRFWLYLEGRRDRNGFLAKYDNSKFILLQYPSELAGAIPTSPLRFVPGLFISLGVFGTFWGITNGLQGLDVGSSSEQLIEASAVMVDGMKTAFYTSLIGIAGSIILTIVQGLLQNERRRSYDKLRHRLDKVAFMESSARLLARQDTSGMVEVAELFKAVTETLGSLSAEAIGQAVGREVTPVFGEIRNELQGLRSEIGKDRQELIEALIREQEERLIKPVIGQLEESAKLTREASETVTTLKDELGGIAKELAAAVQTIQDFQKDTLTKLQEFSEGLAKTLTEFTQNQEKILRDTTEELRTSIVETTREQTQLIRAVGEEAANTMQTASTELQNTLGNLDERLGQFVDNLGTRLDQFCTLLDSEFNKLLRDMQSMIESTTQQQTDLIRETGEKAAETITTASTESANTLEKISREASEMLSNSAEQLRTTLATIDIELTKIRETMQIELAKFRDEYMQSLAKFFEDNDKKLEKILLEYSGRMEQNVTRMDEALQEDYTRRIDIHEKIQSEVETVEQFATRLGLTSADRMGQLESIVGQLGTEAKQIQDRYDGFIAVLNAGFEKSHDHLRESLEEVWKHEMEFFDRADKSVGELTDRLSHAATTLIVAEQSRQALSGEESNDTSEA